MRVPTKLKSVSYILATAIIVLLSAVIWLLIITRSANSDLRLADEIQINFLERTSLRDQYFLYHDDLIRMRWEESKQHSDRLLRQARLQLRDKESLENIGALVRNIDESAAIFNRIVANSNALKSAGGNREILEELDKRLSSQLLLKSTLIRDTIFSLKNSALKSVQQRYRQLTAMIFLFAGSFSIGIILWNILLKQQVESKTIHLENEITERLLAEEALLASETHFRSYYELGLIGMAITSREKGWIQSNDFLCSMLGYSREELFDRTWAEMTHPDDIAADEEQSQKVLRGEIDSYTLDNRFIHKNGQIIYTALSVKCVRGLDGAPDHFVVMVQDITERKRKEEDLKKMKNMLSEGEGIAHMGTFEYVVDTNATLWSEGEYCLYGLDPEGPSPTYDVMLAKNIHPDDAALLHKTFTAAIQSGSVYELEHRIVRSDGSVRWVHDRANPYFDQNGKLARYVGSTLDITERKQILQELRDKNIELDLFAYTVSHDLKSPLVTIQAYAGMIRKDLETGKYERAQDDMRRIEGAADKMNNLLNDLLELSRAGRMMNEPSPVDMNRLVKDTLQQLTGPIADSHVEIVLHPDLPSVFGDQKRIAEVVQNLIENAIKYMGDQAAPRIEIGTRQEGKECVFYVSDNGKGIDPSHHETIFGLFNKLDAKSEGTGVGLALVKSVIEIHGGQVWVESAGAGKGSTFCFTVPLTNK